MHIETALKINNYLSNKIGDMLKQKGHDYANESNTLANFIKQANIASILELDESPKCQALRLVVLKLIRITNLWMNNKEPNNESILDTVLDGINYLQLAYMCYLDAEGQTEKLEIYIDTLNKSYPITKTLKERIMEEMLIKEDIMDTINKEV